MRAPSRLLLLAASALFTIAVATSPPAAHPLAPRQSSTSEEAYLSQVCTPSGVPQAPCQLIIDIEAACQPNGTSPLAFAAHQQCMCGGSFFSDWLGCLSCLTAHGGRSPSQSAVFSAILSSASNSLCTGTPTASFAAIFASLTNAPPQATGAAATATQMSDQYPSQTAVSLYFTASGNQGPGAITGSAAQATATGGGGTAGGTSGAAVSSGATATGAVGSSASSAAGSGTEVGSVSAPSTSKASSASAAGVGAMATANVFGGLLAVGGLVVAAL
jgi:hypothetical protein